MRLLVLVPALAISLAAGGEAVAANGAVACVQGQLNALGHDAGTVDGLFGNRTREAGNAFAGTSGGAPLDLPALSVENADFWCLRLAGASDATAGFYDEFVGETPAGFDPRFSIDGARQEFLFDGEFYFAQLEDPLQPGADPRLHYMTKGWKLGYDPSPLFDTDAYLAANPDVAATGRNPLGHYIADGMDEMRGFGSAPDETGFAFDVDPDVPEGRLAEIREGLVIAQDYLDAATGWRIDPDIAAHIVVRVVASGDGNTERGGGGASATALSSQNDTLPRLFFDVGHREWNQDLSGWGWSAEANNSKTAVHEFVHGWQNLLGAMTIYEQPLGNWMNEGMAEYLAYRAMADAGSIPFERVPDFMANAARNDQLGQPLADFGGTNAPAWPGHVGFLAIDWLVSDAPEGERALRVLGEEVGAGATVRLAFLKAFGIELNEFYRQFEPFRLALASNPQNGLAARPPLVRASAAYIAAALGGSGAEPSDDEGYGQLWFENGYRAYTGEGVAQDDAEAAAWYLKAAEAGHVVAMRNLAGMYGTGRGVLHDDNEMRRWLLLAAEAGDAYSQYTYARAFAASEDERIAWLEAAVAQGLPEARALLEELRPPSMVAPEVLRLSGLEVPGDPNTTTQYRINISFEGDASGVDELCFFWSGQGPICWDGFEVGRAGNVIVTGAWTGRAGEYELSAYAVVDGDRTNMVSVPINVR